MAATQDCNNSVSFLNELLNVVLNNIGRSSMSGDFKDEIVKHIRPSCQNYYFSCFGELVISSLDLSFITAEVVRGWAENKTTMEIAEVVGYFQEEWNQEEKEAHKWHRDPIESDFSKSMRPLSEILNKRFVDEALAKADQELLLVPQLNNDRYSDFRKAISHFYRTCDILYVRDAETGKYVLSTWEDDRYWGNEDSLLADQLEMNDKFIDTVEGIYRKGDDGRYHQFIPKDNKFYFSVVSDTMYWKYSRNGEERSVLYSINPKTDEFEEINLPIERVQGKNFLTTVFKNEAGEWRRGFYVRDIETGKFIVDGDIPFEDYDDDCRSASYNDEFFTATYGIRRKKYTYSGRVGGKGQIEVSDF